MLGFSSVSAISLSVTSIITGKREGHVAYQPVKPQETGVGKLLMEFELLTVLKKHLKEQMISEPTKLVIRQSNFKY